MQTEPLISQSAADAFDVDDLAAGFAPRCPACLGTSEPREVGRFAVWRCTGCGLSLIG